MGSGQPPGPLLRGRGGALQRGRRSRRQDARCVGAQLEPVLWPPSLAGESVSSRPAPAAPRPAPQPRAHAQCPAPAPGPAPPPCREEPSYLGCRRPWPQPGDRTTSRLRLRSDPERQGNGTAWAARPEPSTRDPQACGDPPAREGLPPLKGRDRVPRALQPGPLALAPLPSELPPLAAQAGEESCWAGRAGPPQR